MYRLLMRFQIPSLAWLKTFEAVARHASFTAAGQELGLTQAAVSQHIKSLETRLGCRLFVRGSRPLDLTDMGRAYLQPVRKAIDELVLSTLGLFGSRHARTLTVRAPISYAAFVIAPGLGDFRRAHPNIGVRLISSIWAEAIADPDVDVDVRLGDGVWPGVRAELLSDENVVPVCAPELATRIRDIGDFDRENLIHILGFDDLWSRYMAQTGQARDTESEGLSVDTSLSAVEVAEAGGGVALVIERFARRRIAEGRLAVPINDRIPLGQAHYLVEPPETKPLREEADLFRRWLRSVAG